MNNDHQRPDNPVEWTFEDQIVRIVKQNINRIREIPRVRDYLCPSIECMKRIIKELEGPIEILNAVQDPGPWNWTLVGAIFDKFDFLSQEVWLNYHRNLSDSEILDISVSLTDALEFWRILMEDYETRGFEEDVAIINRMVAEGLLSVRSRL